MLANGRLDLELCSFDVILDKRFQNCAKEIGTKSPVKLEDYEDISTKRASKKERSFKDFTSRRSNNDR